MLPLLACGLLQPGFSATQTAAVQTTVAASWTATPTLTATPDPCSPEKLRDSVSKMHDFMVKFDNLSGEAAYAERKDLPEKIAGLEDVLQSAEAQDAPSCLADLKDHQVKHMRLAIKTLNAFINHADDQVVNDLLQQARDEHDAYMLELMRLLGLDGTPTPAKQVL